MTASPAPTTLETLLRARIVTCPATVNLVPLPLVSAQNAFQVMVSLALAAPYAHLAPSAMGLAHAPTVFFLRVVLPVLRLMEAALYARLGRGSQQTAVLTAWAAPITLDLP